MKLNKLTSLFIILAISVTSIYPAYAKNQGKTSNDDLIEKYITEFSDKTQSLNLQIEESLLNDHNEDSNLMTAGDDSENLIKQKDIIREETVQKLNLAGFEAYNVTPYNYNFVEETLNTDFETLGMDSQNSYIIVVNGEDDGVPNPASTTGSSFNYTYNGKTYKLRYLTITAADDSDYGKASTVNVLKSASKTLITNCLNTAISVYISSISNTLGIISSICGLDISKINTSQTMTLNMNCGSNWTRVYTQVYSDYDSIWETGSSVEYVRTSSYMSGQYYSSSSNKYVSVPQNSKSNTTYSSKYSDTNWRKQQAVLGFLSSVIKWNTTGSVQYKYGGTTKVTHSENF